MSHLARCVRELRERELRERDPWKRQALFAQRWVYMVRHEFMKDDVRIRAESLAFLTSFSLLPLIAGGFFIFTIFAQFGMAQDAIQSFVERFLLTIPEIHRTFVEDYILKFKDAYLASMSQKSGSIGIFALFILIWVGVQAFNNVDRTLNHIWSSERERPFLEVVRNFLFVSVAAPLVLVAGLSVPLILRKAAATRYVFDSLPVLTVLMNNILAPLLILGTFALVYKFVPVRTVKWRSACVGALFTTLLLELSNTALQIYFRFGTNTAYGKAAIVPLLGFWIYVIWIIVILGAEVSFLMQNESDFFVSTHWQPSLREGEALLLGLMELSRAMQDGSNPVSFDRLRRATQLDTAKLRTLLQYLIEQGWIAEAVGTSVSEGSYLLARDVREVSVSNLIESFYQDSWNLPQSAIGNRWEKGLKQWTASFKTVTLSDLMSKTKV